MNYNGTIVNTLNGTVNFPGVCNASSLTVQQPIVSNITSVPTVSNQIGYTQTVVATGRFGIPQNSWANVNSLSVTLSTVGVYIIHGTIPVILSSISTGTPTQIIYSLSTSSNANCFTQCLSSLGYNWIHFHANNTVTDAQILCTAGTSGTSNVGNLNFYCNEAVFNCGIAAGYAAYNKLATSMPGYDTHRWTFNCRGFDTMYT